MLLVSACGRKGDPRAPEQAMPQTIKDLRARAEAGGVVLTWGRPTRYVDGKELKDLAGFVIFRKDIPKITTCPDCPIPYRERISVNVQDQERFMKKKQYRIVDQEVSAGIVYRYRVFSQLADGSLSEPSNEVEIAWQP